ncbi:MAG: formylglycine-generating enzyme family protein [Akkermansiaceae bacterium]
MRLFLISLCLLGIASAEYRVALLLGESTSTAQSDLESLGFRCTISEPLSEKELRRKVEGWASNTPTNSTAVVYFDGEVKEMEYNKEKTLGLVASNDRLVALPILTDYLVKRGGSRRNILIANSSFQPKLTAPLPDGCHFSYQSIKAAAGEFGISGKGSIAISPPEKFVAGRKIGDEWVNQRGMVFCWIPPGSYIAGSPEGTPGRFPDEEQRKVEIKEGFWMGKYEVTRSQSTRGVSRNSIGSHKNHPIEEMHWDDGRPMASRTLTQEERKAGRLPDGWQYDVPTEEQWEYAARAGRTTRYYFGDDMTHLPKHGNFADKSFYDSGDIFSNHAHRTLDDGFVKVAPVGSFAPNPWGLHDVYGNVAEWCRDHSARGGSWVSLPENCRSAYRDHYSSRNQQNYLGYRFVIQPNVPEVKKK